MKRAERLERKKSQKEISQIGGKELGRILEAEQEVISLAFLQGILLKMKNKELGVMDINQEKLYLIN